MALEKFLEKIREDATSLYIISIQDSLQLILYLDKEYSVVLPSKQLRKNIEPCQKFQSIMFETSALGRQQW